MLHPQKRQDIFGWRGVHEDQTPWQTPVTPPAGVAGDSTRGPRRPLPGKPVCGGGGKGIPGHRVVNIRCKERLRHKSILCDFKPL